MPTNPKHSDAYYRALATEVHQVDGECEIDEDAVVSRNDDGENGCYVAAWVWVDDPMLGDLGKNEFDQWDTRCPECGVDGELKVGLVTLVRTGERQTLTAALESDGFVFSVDDDKDQSTTDEHVYCASCDAGFTLDDLMLRGEEEEDTCRVCGGTEKAHRIPGCTGEEIKA